MKNILEYLEQSASKYGEKIAIIEEDKKCKYNELIQLSKKIGSGISKYVQTKNPVPVLMEKGINAVEAFFGVVYAGGFYVLLNPELPINRLESILDTLQANILITDNKNISLASQLMKNKTVLLIEDLQKENINEEQLEKIRKQAIDVDPLYANFTSGSTGIPKGVLIAHRSVIDFIDVFTKEFNINDKDIIANQAPFDFDVSVKDIYSAISTGATLLIIPRKLFSEPMKLLDYICENNATTLIWAVSALCLVTTFHALDYKLPTSLKKVLFSGEVMPVKHLKQWIEKLPNVQYVNLYGPTEITCNCTYFKIENNREYEKLPIGQPFENEQVFLLDEKDNLITDKMVIGEICVRGTALALGYYNNKEQTEKLFIQNPLNKSYMDIIYKSGDLGYIGEDNNLYFSGRKDFQIKHLGHRIELEEIERKIEEIKQVERACCIYDEEKSKIYAFYIGNIDKKDLKDKIKDELPVFMVPNVLRQIEQFPITKNGKIDRKQLLLMKKEEK